MEQIIVWQSIAPFWIVTQKQRSGNGNKQLYK